MGVTNYHTINGRIVGQTKNGVRTHYVPDALGSIVATLDANGTVENTYRYKPYGSLLAKTGTGDDPRFMWVGTLGYRATLQTWSDFYTAKMHYASKLGSWTTPRKPWSDSHSMGAMLDCPDLNDLLIGPVDSVLTFLSLPDSEVSKRLLLQAERSSIQRWLTNWQTANPGKEVCREDVLERWLHGPV